MNFNQIDHIYISIFNNQTMFTKRADIYVPFTHEYSDNYIYAVQKLIPYFYNGDRQATYTT